MNLNVIIARGPRAIPARINKVTSNEVRRMIIDANDDDIPLNVIWRLAFANWYLDKLAEEDVEFLWLDEVPFNLSMRVSYGRSLVGTRAEDRVPKIKSKNVTVMAAMNTRGVLLKTTLPGNGNRIECET